MRFNLKGFQRYQQNQLLLNSHLIPQYCTILYSIVLYNIDELSVNSIIIDFAGTFETLLD